MPLHFTPFALGFPGGSVSKESACHAEDPGLIPPSGRSPGEGNGNPLQQSCLGHPMDRGAWSAIVHSIAKTHHLPHLWELGKPREGKSQPTQPHVPTSYQNEWRTHYLNEWPLTRHRRLAGCQSERSLYEGSGCSNNINPIVLPLPRKRSWQPGSLKRFEFLRNFLNVSREVQSRF